MNFRVTGVHKALGSVSAICDRGQRVVFDNDGCYIEDKVTLERIPFEREDDVYNLKVRVPQPNIGKTVPLAPIDKVKAAKRSDFHRLASHLP